jgi:alanine racemase
MFLARCTLEIDLAKIKANYRILRSICINSLVGAVVKANSYGLGANDIVKALQEEDCRFFFVASSDEAIALRRALNDQSNILVLNGVFQNDALELIKYNLTPVLNSLWQIEIWNKLSNLRQKPLPCFLHVNTGINRLGLTHDEIEYIINNKDLLIGLDVQYIISHLASSEDIDDPYNLEQLIKLKNYLRYFPNVKASIANSSAIFLGENYHFDLVRPGAALYGLNPLSQDKVNPMLNPVTLKAPIINLQNLIPGSAIGYNRSFTTNRNSIIATLPLGYGDGYSRSYSNNGEVVIKGYKAPVVGRVSMDLISIDVTDLPPAEIFLGQEAEIIGDNCTPDKIAGIIGTIGREILASLGNRYKKTYKNDI